MSDGHFDPGPAIEALLDHGVRFVIIGGVAAQLLGSPTVTRDLDICYSRDVQNLEHLAAALRQIGARLRGRNVPEDLPFRLDAATLAAGDHFTFATSAGPFDILGVPSGSEGFDQLVRNAVRSTYGEREVLVAHIDDLITMKRAAGRRKDLIMVEELGALRDRLDEGTP